MSKEDFCAQCGCGLYEDFGGFDEAWGAVSYSECWECRIGEDPDSPQCRHHDDWLDLTVDDLEPVDQGAGA